MAKFNLDRATINPERTARFVLHELSGEDPPSLLLAPATEANKPFFNATLRRAKHWETKPKTATAALVDELRDSNRALFAQHVIKGWDRVFDYETGGPVPYSFTQDNALTYLQALPDHVFDAVKRFAEDSANFTNEALDAQAAAKN